jgi:hypothetical protein
MLLKAQACSGLLEHWLLRIRNVQRLHQAVLLTRLQLPRNCRL